MRIVYETPWLDTGYWLLIVGTPLLLFIGYFLAKILFRDREYDVPENVVVMPQDYKWRNYTNDYRVIMEISRAVVQVQSFPPVTYQQIYMHLVSEEAHRVAQNIGTFHVYREQDIRAYLDEVDAIRQSQFRG
ncbi:hypothetical protein [Tumebacillus flagellatus]|uniref:Uncharacterized protein n=1 Tax=Tumebacillus flagellatus TaxID=1157490 RepID=A0A074LND5_9BACL|nr:hypothetical protein [Tumebacillus flagellatus]KEO83626.1 hypothetical protein EL26_09455 [Tumebacillus flagellatus]